MKARYEVVFRSPRLLVIRDVGHGAVMSITNDVEAILADLHRKGWLEDQPMLAYYDSAGDLDELVYTGYQFLSFRFLAEGRRKDIEKEMGL